MRLLVSGGRKYADKDRLTAILDPYLEEPELLLIQGGAAGADWLAKDWAFRNGIPVAEFQANWDYQGYAAGNLRNQAMKKWGQPDATICFPGGYGTLNMARHMWESGNVQLVDMDKWHIDIRAIMGLQEWEGEEE